MNERTIRCRLHAPEETLRYWWLLMAQKNTPLITQLLEGIRTHPDISQWLNDGKLPSKLVETLADSLKKQPQFQSVPGRFNTSAITLVKIIYLSWFALQEQNRFLLHNKRRWLEILKSDTELEQESSYSINNIRTEAHQILQTLLQELELTPLKEPSQKNLIDPILWKALWEQYRAVNNSLQRSAIIYLFKNKCQISEAPEDLNILRRRKRATAIQIKRLEKQLQASLPQGRDLENVKWLEALQQAQELITEVEEFNQLQACLLRQSKSLPFPVFYGSNTDLKWFTNEQGHICVQFNGLSKYPLEVRCDRRQLHWFKRFLDNYEKYIQHPDQSPPGLMALRSAFVLWQECEGKGEPWQTHKLMLHCSIDLRLWTAEGTEAIKTEKLAQTQKTIDNFHKKEQLNQNQAQKLQAKETSSQLLQGFQVQDRPKRVSYQGNPSVIMGVSLGWEDPVTIAIVDISTKTVLAYRSTKQLLNSHNQSGKHKSNNTYHLLNRWREKQRQNSHKRHAARIKDAPDHYGESNLGVYLDRLFAKAILKVAQEYRVSLIVLPQLKHIREIVESEVRARAEMKIPSLKEAQDLYAKEYRMNVHKWSYNRLTDFIEQKATSVGIPIKIVQPSLQGTPQEKARDLVFSFFNKEREESSKKCSKSEKKF